MVTAEAVYHQLLSSEFKRRKARNPAYSLRAYSRFLDMHPSTLSHVLQNKRVLAFKDAFKISEKLKLSPEEKKNFFSSLNVHIARKQKSLRKLFAADNQLDAEKAFKIIAEWEHYALLYLMQTCDFQNDRAWIARRLGLSLARTQEVIANLLDLRLLIFNQEGELEATQSYLSTSDEHLSRALQLSHKDSLQSAIAAFDHVEFHARDCTASVFTLNPADLPALKKEIRNFYQRIEKYLKKKNRSEVYEICVALFPRTKLRKTPTKSKA